MNDEIHQNKLTFTFPSESERKVKTIEHFNDRFSLVFLDLEMTIELGKVLSMLGAKACRTDKLDAEQQQRLVVTAE
jgi:hypothetical protein